MKNDTRVALWKAAADQAVVELGLGGDHDRHSGSRSSVKTSANTVWRLLRRDNGSYDYLSANDFFDLKSSDANKTQLGLQNFGYFTISYGKIHIWPLPSGAPTGDAGWTAC